MSYYVEQGDVLRVLELGEDEDGVPFARVLNEALEPLAELRVGSDGVAQRFDLAASDRLAWALLQPGVLGALPESERFPASALVPISTSAPKLANTGIGGSGPIIVIAMCPGGYWACLEGCIRGCGATDEDCITRSCHLVCRGVCPVPWGTISP